MDKQEMFNIAVTKVWEQGKPAMDANGTCCYHDGFGNRCAVGWLLPEDIAQTYSGAGAVYSLLEKTREGDIPEFIRYNSDFLLDLQRVHDNSEPKTFKIDFKRRAEQFARKFNLTMPILV